MSDGATLARGPAVDHRPKEDAFFLAVMRAVGKTGNEVGRLEKEPRAHRARRIQVAGRRLERVEHALDHPVFLHQYLNGLHH